MAAVHSKAPRRAPQESARLSIADLVLIRVACADATRAELQRDLASLVAPKVPGTAFRRMAELAIGQHAAQSLLTETKGRLTATAAGLKVADALTGTIRVARETWEAVRNGPLVALALGVNGESPAIAKALERADGLAALILQKHYHLATQRVLSANDLRADLAVIALEKAFGNKIKTGLNKGSGLPGKTARLLAGQLFKRPREFSSDGKLVAALAAEVAGAGSEALDSLRLALLRRLTQPFEDEETAPQTARADSTHAEPKADNDAAPLKAPLPKFAGPDMSEFVSAVLDAARPVSEGWPGNRKAFISHVWQAIRTARREWELTEIAFKSMLAEAHRTGRLVLAAADLKDRRSLQELEDSKILYKNTVWHFVRVED